MRLETGEVKTMGQAWGIFRRKVAPQMIGAAAVAALALRLALGNFTWQDIAAVAFMAVVYPFGEWAIHVHLLHQPPFKFRGRMIELPSSKSHREHHEEPHRLDWVNFGPIQAVAVLFAAAPVATAAGGLLFSLLPGPLHWEAMVSMLATAYVLIGVYEWIHFLIHTAHKPRSRYYKAIYKNHRLHHFKNEHYWHGITNTVSDRVLGTLKDQSDIERSPTARTLHGPVS